jgi:hypothetical protein
MTGESALLQHATLQMKKIASDGERSAQERIYMKSLCCSVETADGYQELTFLQSFLLPVKKWSDKQLRDYHLMSSEVCWYTWHFHFCVLVFFSAYNRC